MRDGGSEHVEQGKRGRGTLYGTPVNVEPKMPSSTLSNGLSEVTAVCTPNRMLASIKVRPRRSGL